jgi:hypothetical protein
MPRSVRFALAAWGLVALLFLALDPSAAGQPLAFARRLASLVLPSLLVWGVAWLLALPFGARRRGHAIGATLCGLLALPWLLLGPAGRWLFASPFGFVPWGDPHFVYQFAARHPQLEVSTWPIEVRVSDREGRFVELRPLDLLDAQLAFEPCGDGLGPERFGGLPPHPASRCAFRYRLEQPEHTRLVYVYRIESDERLEPVRPHFERWAESIGADVGGTWSGSSGSRNQGGRSEGTLEIRDGERTRYVRIVQRRYDASIYLPEGGATPP